MLQVHANKIRGRLRLGASAAVIAAAALATAAGAATTVTVANGNSYSLGVGGTTYVVPTGLTAEMIDDGGTAPVVAGNPVLYGGTWLDSAYSSMITVNSGATLIFRNPAWWQATTSMINANGNVVISQGTAIFMGANTFNGNVTVGDYGNFTIGQNWYPSNVTFSSSTNLIFGTGVTSEFYVPHALTNTINTISSTGGTTLTFWNGSMIVDGINTAAKPFLGSVIVNAGATFAVGDATHATAVFGDPTASATTINVNQSGGTVGSLKGYGTIYGTVVNDSLVAAGGTSGTTGTLTIRGGYTQNADGELVAEVTPTGASNLNVVGTAKLAGTLLVKIDDGSYTTPGLYNILTATTVSGSFSTINVQGNAAFVGTVKTTTGYQVAVESQNSAQSIGHQVSSNRYNVAAFNRALYDQIATPSQGSGEGGKAVISTWLTPFGGIENTGRSGIGYSNTEYGVRGGLEIRPQARNAVIGLAASYGSGTMDMKGETSSADTNTYNLALYGGADLLNARVDGTIFYSAYDASITRGLGTYGSATSTPQGTSWGTSVQLSKSLYDDLITPYFRAIYTSVHQDAATEAGNASFALAYDRFNENTVLADLGFRVRAISPKADLPVKLDFTLAVEHDFSNKGETVKGAFANITGSSVIYNWKGDAENALLAGIDFSDQLTDKLALFARLDGQFSTNKRAGDFSVGAKYRF